jgi:uncharacterized membrane protein
MLHKTLSKLSGISTALNRNIQSYNYLGLVFAVIFFCLSLYPSLLPRSWFFQGLLSGIALAIGYGLGTLASFLIRWLFERDVLPHFKETAWRVLFALGALFMVVFLILGASWQEELRTLVEVAPLERPYIIFVFLLSIASGIMFIKLGRSIRKFYHWLLKKIDRLMPRRISMAISFVLAVACISWVVSGAFIGFLGTTSSYIFDRKNRSTPEGIVQPTESSRSGSKDSLIAWDTLGYQGQAFVGQGPSQAQLQDFTGTEPTQPIRAYVGVNSAQDVYERADLAVKELHRTGAFEREVLVVAIPTGTGWLNAQSVDALEYIHGGDTAIISQQYSFLPSWISFLVDKEKAQETGKALFNAVYAEWSELPENERPKLLMYGLSLGAFGGQAAFSGPSDMIHSVDGALWQGTPGDTELWKEVSRRRDANSPQWQPTIDGGNNIRFASQNAEIIKDQSTWDNKRVLYIQHGSDPIVWFNFDLPLHKPDWLGEQRAPDVMQNTIWVPFVTFFQLAADQVVGMGVPKNYGHNYETTVADAWSALYAPEGWTQEKSDELQSIINRY